MCTFANLQMCKCVMYEWSPLVNVQMCKYANVQMVALS